MALSLREGNTCYCKIYTNENKKIEKECKQQQMETNLRKKSQREILFEISKTVEVKEKKCFEESILVREMEHTEEKGTKKHV